MMKKVVTLIGLMCLLAGCSSTGKLIATSSSTVEKALKAWAVFYVDGHATVDQERKVRVAQQRYYASEDAALDAYLEWNKTGDRTVWQKAKAELLLAEKQLINLLREFGVKGV